MSNDASVSSISSSTHYDDSEKEEQESGVGNESSSPGQPNSEATTAQLEPQTTKVYYYVDKEKDPFATTVNVPLSQLTLKDFIKTLHRTNYKYFNHKLVDGVIEKTEVKDDNDLLSPCENNKIFLTLLTDEQATPIALAPTRHVVPLRKQSQALQHASYRGSRFSKPSNNYLRRRNSLERIERMPRPSFAEDTDYGCDSRARWSDGDSEAFTDFTSVSQQRKKRVLRHSRKQSSNNYYRRQMSPSFVSTSFSDASMAIDVIEIEFDLSKGRLGLKIMVTEEHHGFCILVAEIEPNSLAARDKRIKPDMIILEVNEHRLANYTKDDAVELLRQACTTGARYVTFTFAQTEREKFTPRDDTVLPIDTSAWVKQTMLQPINEECRLKMVYNPCCLNAGGFPSSGVGSSVCDSDSSFPANPNMTQLYQLQPKRFNVQSKMDIAVAMVLPGGLELKHKTNGKKTFASTEMVDWLRSNVHGLEEAEKCHKFANKLVEDGLIALVIDNKQFVVKTEGYYYFTDKLQKLAYKHHAFQKPAMDDTLHVPQKGLTARIKKFFCVGNRQQPQQQQFRRPIQEQQPTAVRQLHNENIPPTLFNQQPPSFQPYRSSLYTQSRTHQTYIP
uniref:Uncharacterized protein n=1 Tax=Panagrolaimus sp. PS1159 TaxID=55785 RepID=A0AC35G9I2_9BILA